MEKENQAYVPKLKTCDEGVLERAASQSRRVTGEYI